MLTPCFAQQPVLNIKKEVVGYEMRVASAYSDPNWVGLDDWLDVVAAVGSDVFLRAPQALDPDADLPGNWPSNRIIVDLPMSIAASPNAMDTCRRAKARGFRVAIEDFDGSPCADDVLGMASHIKFDLKRTTGEGLARQVRKMPGHSTKIVARNVDTNEDFIFCRDLGITRFQGRFFIKAEASGGAKIVNPAQTSILELLNKIRNDASDSEIEMFFKRDVALSIKLLRYLNSVGFGMSREIQSIKHALTVLGRQQMFRWLTLLLATANGTNGTPALAKTAITRGRFAELLGRDVLARADIENLFIVGVFSLLEAMLGVPMQSILEKLPLPAAVNEALLHRQGVYGPFLSLVEACEGYNFDEIDRLAASLHLEPIQVNQAHVDALDWVRKLGL